MNIRKKLLGDKAFYAKVLAVTVPIMIQNGITNFVGLLDNIMVGRIGTEQMSGIAIVNQLLMVFNLAIFGAISGVGIFGAQFFGCKNYKGVQHTLRFKIYVGLGILVLGTIILMAGGDQLIQMYLHGEGNEQALQATLGYGREYLWVMLIGLPPFVLEEIYASTLREGGETKVPMIAGVVAVLVNLTLNYLLIFGKFGFPELGVVGAAIATVISRYVQMVVVIAWTHRNPEKMPFITGAYREWKVPGQLTWNIFRKGTPLMLNEILWSAGMAIMTQCYSTRGLDAVAALNISTVISNLFNVVFVAMGSAVSIIVGQLLGAGKMEEAKDTDGKLIAFDGGNRVRPCAPVPEAVQYQYGGKGAGNGAPAGGGAVHAYLRVPAHHLFHPALRRKDDHHVPLRQRVPLVRQHPRGLCAQPPQRHGHSGAVPMLPDAGPDQMRHRVRAGEEGRVAEQYRGVGILGISRNSMSGADKASAYGL